MTRVAATATREVAGARVGARLATTVVVASTIVVALAGLSLTIGAPTLTLPQAIAALDAPTDDRARIAVVELRIPRILLAVLAGSTLAVAGAMLQDAMRNPLASPDLIGVGSGASLVVAIVAILHLPIPRAAVPVAALAGGLAVGLAVLLLAARARSPATLALAGLAISSALSGAIVAVLAIGAPADIGLLTSYLLGSLANRGWDAVAIVWPWALGGLVVAPLLAPRLDALRLGDEVAHGLGIHVARTRRAVVVVCCALVAAVVSACGPIGFVALLVPHLVRSLLGTHRTLPVVVASIVVGACAVLGADAVGAILAEPREIAVGAWLALLGGPLLLLALRRSRVLA